MAARAAPGPTTPEAPHAIDTTRRALALRRRRVVRHHVPRPRLRHRLLRRPGARGEGQFLDIACGTGRVLLPVLQAGVDADGMDLFQPMLDTAPEGRRSRIIAGPPPRRHGRLPDAAPLCPGHDYLQRLLPHADDGGPTPLPGVHPAAPAPGGLLAFDGSFPGLAWIGAPQDRRELEGETKHPPPGRRCAATTSAASTASRRCSARGTRSNWTRPTARPASSTARSSSCGGRTRPRWSCCCAAGFARYEVCGGFDRRPLTQETDEMVVLARAGE